MHIQGVKIKNFRSFSDFSVTFQKGLNVIIGSNNAGKSSLIKVIDMLSNDYKISIDDFNRNVLLKEFKGKYLKTPPEIEFSYLINHEVNDDEYQDENILKLLPFTSTDQIQQIELPIEESPEEKIVHGQGQKKFVISAHVKRVFKLDENYLKDYEERNQNCESLDEYCNLLKKYLDNYKWVYYNGDCPIIDTAILPKTLKDLFHIELVNAHRDAGEMTSKVKKNIQAYIKKQDEDKFNKIDDEISAIISEGIGDIIGNVHSLVETEQAKIGLSAGQVAFNQEVKYRGNFSEAYMINVKDTESNAQLPLTHNGLGYNNLLTICMLLKINELNNAPATAEIICVEEPEAHLHPAMQYKLFKYLSELNNEDKLNKQIFITTHSSNITAVAGLDNMISLHYIRGLSGQDTISVVLKDQLEDKQDAKNHLIKFLDVTRSDMFFANSIILVEGIAEKLLLPLFMEKEGYCYSDNHISIVEIGGKHFKYFIAPFIDDGINRKILCVTDNDFPWKILASDATCEKVSYDLDTFDNYTNYVTNEILETFEYKEKANVRYEFQKEDGKTFEDQLFIDNFSNEEVAIRLLKLALPDTLQDFISTNKLLIESWNSNINNAPTKSRNKILSTLCLFYSNYSNSTGEAKERLQKLFFASLFLDYAKEHKGNIALNILTDNYLSENILTPTYIKRGIEWLKN